MVAKKDYFKDRHSEELDVPNLEVIGLLRSFRSKGYVNETFNWQYYYWYLTNEGIEYLREYLNLSADVVPNTLKKSTRPPTRPMADERPPRGDRPGDVQPHIDFSIHFIHVLPPRAARSREGDDDVVLRHRSRRRRVRPLRR